MRPHQSPRQKIGEGISTYQLDSDKHWKVADAGKQAFGSLGMVLEGIHMDIAY